MPPWLLRHRVTVTERPIDYCDRAQLNRRGAPTRQRMTLLMVPGGFGKTTLLAECCRDAMAARVTTARATTRGLARALKLSRWLLAVGIPALVGIAFAAQDRDATHLVSFFPSASDFALQGFSCVINHSTEAREVYGEAFDDPGPHFDPLAQFVGAGGPVGRWHSTWPA